MYKLYSELRSIDCFTDFCKNFGLKQISLVIHKINDVNLIESVVFKPNELTE